MFFVIRWYDIEYHRVLCVDKSVYLTLISICCNFQLLMLHRFLLHRIVVFSLFDSGE